MPSNAEADASALDTLIQSAVRQIQEGRLDDALAELEEILRIDPNLPMAHRCRGFLYREKAEFEAALESLNESLRLEPDNALTYSWRGDTFFRLGIATKRSPTILRQSG